MCLILYFVILFFVCRVLESMGHDSGAKKRKRKEKERTLIQSQKGAMDKFIIKEAKASSDNQSVGLATISLESEVLEKIDYEDIIEDFISKNPKRMMLFK
jgi:hypothetical protein